ncbi:hypothetical protein [Hymenobacter siberiensis]|uniref:hypothetical protein n=1 Tax=Hymenobacter siberiensis TaxID=2848396 RepID=UPI001C1E04E0|nr:hypothetical protein [Hymenobacter siberiensis]MBU6119590.1 hypothetical protein [Hymenobacter siberiensis]
MELLLEAQVVGRISKAHVLGHAAANSQTIARIGFCIEQKSTRCLRRVFQDLPYGEDELGLTVIGSMCTVYLLIEPANRTFVAVIGNPDEHSSSQLLLHFAEANGFPYWLVLGKRLVIEQ